MTRQYITRRNSSFRISPMLKAPSLYIPTTPASTIKAPSTVTMVPAIVMITAGDFESPKRDTTG